MVANSLHLGLTTCEWYVLDAKILSKCNLMKGNGEYRGTFKKSGMKGKRETER